MRQASSPPSPTRAGGHVKPLPLDQQFWPYAAEQKAKSLLLLDRLKHWKPILDDIYVFLNQYRDAQESIARDFQKLSKQLGGNTGVSVLLDDAMSVKSIVDGAMGGYSAYTAYSKSLSSVHIHKMNELRNEYSKAVKEFKQKTEYELHSLERERLETVKYFEKHQKEFDLVRVKKSTFGPEIDPWITGKLATRQMEKSVARENEAQTNFCKLHQEMMMFEAKLSTGLITGLNTFIESIQKHDEGAVRSLITLRNFADRMNPQAQFQAFCSKHGLLNAPCFSQRRSVADFNWIGEGDDSTEIKKQGILYRQGKVRKSHFKRSLYVLTENGFLHCFPAKNHLEPLAEIKAKTDKIEYSIYLRRPKVIAKRSPINVNCIEIFVPGGKPGLFGASDITYIFKADTEREVNEWLETISGFLAMNRDRPEVEAPMHFLGDEEKEVAADNEKPVMESTEHVETLERDEATKGNPPQKIPSVRQPSAEMAA